MNSATAVVGAISKMNVRKLNSAKKVLGKTKLLTPFQYPFA